MPCRDFRCLCWDFNFYGNSLCYLLHGIFQVVLSHLFPDFLLFRSPFLVPLLSAPPVFAYFPFPSKFYAFIFPIPCGLWIICAIIFPSTSLSSQSLSILFCLHPFFFVVCFLVLSYLSNVSLFSLYIIPFRIFILTPPFPITWTCLSSFISRPIFLWSQRHSFPSVLSLTDSFWEGRELSKFSCGLKYSAWSWFSVEGYPTERD